MTLEETELLIRYMLTLYPSKKLSEAEFKTYVQNWHNEFKNESRDIVVAGFKDARVEDPRFIPTVPMIQNAIQDIRSKIRVKSKEQEFRDSHCGKSEAEWNSMVEWEQSQDGSKKLATYKDRLSKLFGGRL